MTTPFARSLRARGKSPRVDHVRNTYPMLVRNGILDRVKLIPFFSTFTFSTNHALQIQPQSLPFCGVYLMQEIMSPDGDANVGEVRFRTSARIGFSVIVLNNDADAAENKLDAAMQALTGGLFADRSLYDNDVFKIQSFASGSRMHRFGNATSDNETPIAELRFELTCDLGVITYPPYVPDDLEVIHVKTDFPIDGTQADKTATQQVVSEYDLDQ